MAKIKWDGTALCPYCGLKVARVDPRYDRNWFTMEKNGWVSFAFACTTCRSKGEVKMWVPKLIEV